MSTWVTRDLGEYTVRVERTEHYSRWEILRGGSEWADDGCPVYEPEVGANTMGAAFAKALLAVWEVAKEAIVQYDGD